MRNKRFWRNYYRKNRSQTEPSSFAVFCCKNYLKENSNILELGCGNGRDAFYFASLKLNTHAVDLEKEEISYLKKINKFKNLQFYSKDFTKISKVETYDFVYSRFTIHSINDEQEKDTLKNTFKNLKPDGLFLIEARSTKDDMFQKSIKISEYEGETDHYRRFVNYTEFLERLHENGFKIIHSQESQNLAIYKDENPWIIRIVAQKSSETSQSTATLFDEKSFIKCG